MQYRVAAAHYVEPYMCRMASERSCSPSILVSSLVTGEDLRYVSDLHSRSIEKTAVDSATHFIKDVNSRTESGQGVDYGGLRSPCFSALVGTEEAFLSSLWSVYFLFFAIFYWNGTAF